MDQNTYQKELKQTQDKEYQQKLSSPEYRHVMKHVDGKKKYYYQLQPGSSFISKISPANSQNQVTLVMKTGSTYTGEINSSNERHGYGVYQVIYGGYYEGQWKNGFKDGNGTFYYRGGIIHYQGQWQCGEPHGKGKVYNSEGKLKFEGQFKNGKSAENINWLDYKSKP